MHNPEKLRHILINLIGSAFPKKRIQSCVVPSSSQVCPNLGAGEDDAEYGNRLREIQSHLCHRKPLMLMVLPAPKEVQKILG